MPGELPGSLPVPAEAVQLMVMARGVAPPQETQESLTARATRLLNDASVSRAMPPLVTAFGDIAGQRHPYVLVVWQA